VLYKEGQYYRFKIIDIKTEAAVLEGLNPLYANPNDYRTVLLALHAKDLLIEELLND
jgi:hypothetical protein